MAEVLTDYISALLIRLRDPAGVIHSRELVGDLLCRAQSIYNEALSLSLISVTFDVQPLQQWYDNDPANAMASLQHVVYRNKDLSKATLDDLKSFDRKWHRRVGDRLECYVPLGYSHFLLWPSLNNLDTCTLIGPRRTNAFNNDPTQTLAISRERTPALL